MIDRNQLSPTRRHTFNKILEASKELFDKKGIDATTIIDIAEKADISRITIYNHINSKEEIVEEIMNDYIIGIYVFDITELEGVTLYITLKNFFTRLLKNYLDNPHMLRFMNRYYQTRKDINHIDQVIEFPNNAITSLHSQLSYLPEEKMKSIMAKSNVIYQYILGLGMRYSISNPVPSKQFGYVEKERVIETLDYILKILDD